MNIKILDSWLREYLDTKAKPSEIAEILSLTSVSVEKIEQVGKDYLYDIEVTTNRPDLMSIVGIAREASVALSSEGIPAKFIEKKVAEPKSRAGVFPIEIKNDPRLVHRISAAVLSVKLGNSPQLIRDRIEASDIRSLNNVVDVTNYVMRELGHPAHAFDLDRLETKKMIIREGKKGEKIVTLDKKEYELQGGEIVADDGQGKIIDLLGIMGTENSSVTDGTKKILLFVDNNDQHRIRKASMNLGIRTDAAILNEKGIDPELTYKALVRGIELLEQIAYAKLESPIFDSYPNKIVPKPIEISINKIRDVMGVDISEKKVIEILSGLSFEIKKVKDKLIVTSPSSRAQDVTIPEDIIEEVARIYGYHKIQSVLPEITGIPPYNMATDRFFWEKKIKYALKYWGFTEIYTSSLISGDLLEVAESSAVKLSNPLGSDLAYLRTTLVPSLLQAVRDNKSYETIKIFELANVYCKKKNDLPLEVLMLSGVVKMENASFFEVKGIITGILSDLGLEKYEFKKRESGGNGAEVSVAGNKVGDVEVLDRNLIDFEIIFDELLKYASLKKTYTPLPKFPQAIEDIRIIVDPAIEFSKIISTIKKSGTLIIKVELLDTYEDKKTFRITYQSKEKNLANQDIAEVREKIIHNLKTSLKAEIT